jgi:hypothetical protein
VTAGRSENIVYVSSFRNCLNSIVGQSSTRAIEMIDYSVICFTNFWDHDPGCAQNSLIVLVKNPLGFAINFRLTAEAERKNLL